MKNKEIKALGARIRGERTHVFAWCSPFLPILTSHIKLSANRKNVANFIQWLALAYDDLAIWNIFPLAPPNSLIFKNAV